MTGKTTLILFIMLLALCAGYWLMLRSEEETAKETLLAKRIFDFEPDAVRAIEIKRLGEPPAAAKRAGPHQWDVTKPNPQIEPNNVVWERIALAVASTIAERVIDPAPTDLAAYGLDDPVLLIDADVQQSGDAQPTHIALKFGAIDPTQTFRYAREGDGAIFLMAAELFHEMDRPLKLLRYPYIINLGEEEITRVEFARFWTSAQQEASSDAPKREIGQESRVVAVQRTEDGQWRMVEPFEADANQTIIDDLVKEIQFATGHRYVDTPEDLSDYGLAQPWGRLTLVAGDKTNTLHFGAFEKGGQADAGQEAEQEVGGLFAKRASLSSVFVMDPHVLTLLPKTPDAYREDRLLTHQATDIRALHYTARASGQTQAADFTLEHDADQGWKLVENKPAEPGTATTAPTDQMAISNFVAMLKAIKGRGFPGDTATLTGLDDPIITITLQLEGQDQPATIKVGAHVPETQTRYATQDNGVVTVLNDLDVDVLTRTPLDFRTRRLLEFKPTELARIELTFENKAYAFTRPRGVWIVEQPDGYTIESQSDITALIGALSELTAAELERETTPEDLAPYGLDRPLATLQVAVQSPGEEGVETVLGPVTVGRTTPEDSQRRFAMTGTRPEVFRIRQAFVDEIRETLRGVIAPQ